MTEIFLGFASSRLYEKNGELHYDMWPAAGTQIGFPVRGPVSGKSVISNSSEELVLRGRVLHYKFRFIKREAGPDAVRYSVRAFGVLPLGTYWGDISGDGKHALRTAFSNQIE